MKIIIHLQSTVFTSNLSANHLIFFNLFSSAKQTNIKTNKEKKTINKTHTSPAMANMLILFYLFCSGKMEDNLTGIFNLFDQDGNKVRSKLG